MGSDRYRLVSLLGGGGEGEVWRAVDASGTEVAVKITPAVNDPFARAVWDEQAGLFPQIRHHGLVRIHEVFTGGDKHRVGEAPTSVGDFRYIIMDYEPGPTLADWLTENPDASVGQRLALLRTIAGVLDWIHAGAGTGTPIAHGDVKPSNVIVRTDGSTVLVDLGLLRLTARAGTTGHSRPYAAPELREGSAAATTAGDAFAFAATTAYALTGVPLPLAEDGYLNLDALRGRLLATPRMRRHRGLVHGLLGALTADPTARPTDLEQWLGAYRRKHTVLLASAAALVITGAAASSALAITLAGNNHATGSRPQALGGSFGGLDKPHVETINDPAPPPTTTGKATPNVTGPDFSQPHVSGSAPLVVVNSWPSDTGCDSYVALAAPPSAETFGTAQRRSGTLLSDLLPNDGGAWQRGLLSFSVAPQERGVVVTGVHVTGTRTAVTPGWVLFPQQDPRLPGQACEVTNPPPPATGSAPPPETPKYYHLGGDVDLDAAAKTDGMQFTSSNGSVGPLSLRPQDRLSFTLQARACTGNYRWQVAVDYRYQDDRTIHTLVAAGDYYVYGTGDATQIYGGYTDSTGTIRVVSEQRWDGPSCNWRPAAPNQNLDPSIGGLLQAGASGSSTSTSAVPSSSTPAANPTTTPVTTSPGTSVSPSTSTSTTTTVSGTDSATTSVTATSSASASATP